MHGALRFHWGQSAGGNRHDSAQFMRACFDAEAAGIESIQAPFSLSLSDALALGLQAGSKTERLRFRIRCGPEQTFLEQLKDACGVLGGRMIVHMQPDGALIDSILDLIANLRSRVALLGFDVEGQTAESAFAAIRHADCLWRLPHRPNQVYADALPVLHFDKEVGLVTSIVARKTREEAMETASILLAQDMPEPKRWIGEHLWLGTPAGGCADIGVLAGSFDEVARAIVGFRSHGISQLLIRDLPGLNEISDFGMNILPLVRAMEAGG
jgi:hypothetical protein